MKPSSLCTYTSTHFTSSRSPSPGRPRTPTVSALNQLTPSVSPVTGAVLFSSHRTPRPRALFSTTRSASFSGKACYEFCTSTLGLKSISFEISENGDSVTFIGSGWGHSLGMSQFGAYAMAKTYGFTYDQIVNFYYTDITLASATYTY